MNLPEGFAVYPLMEVTIGLFVILIIMLIVQIMTLRVLKSFQQPVEPDQNKQHFDNISFKDVG